MPPAIAMALPALLGAVSGLREVVLRTIDWQEQRRRWEGLKGRLASIGSG